MRRSTAVVGLTFPVDHLRMHCDDFNVARLVSETVFKHVRIANLSGHNLGELEESTL